ncbi:alpha/beta hydrolase [Streptomyces sp. NPDC102402]|uniref:alpha/beta hydrolase n=1 Tax=Streptomyces sp. NPDC102402 TaxID=3366169 RepID=UPI00380B546F
MLLLQNRRDASTPHRGGKTLREKFGDRARLVTRTGWPGPFDRGHRKPHVTHAALGVGVSSPYSDDTRELLTDWRSWS